MSDGESGTEDTVVKLLKDEKALDPPAFTAATRQKYLVLGSNPDVAFEVMTIPL